MTLQEQASSSAVLGAEEEALVELLNKIMEAAVADKASDIHLDPMNRQDSKVRFRIDGVLHDVVTLSRKVHHPLVARWKTMSDVNVEEKRIPQDGHYRVLIDDREYDIRGTTLPSVFGEKLTMSILPQLRDIPPLEALGYSKADERRLEAAMVSPMGLMVFASPTGCGRSTCAVSLLQQVVNPDIQVVTIEDPVLYMIEGATQIMVNRKMGMLEAQALRAVLRSDPDVVMVGNLPDQATAELAVEGANSGHLILAPMLADSAAEAIARLYNWCSDPYLLSRALLMVSGQRLARLICPNCKQPAEQSEKLLQKVRQRAEAGGLKWPEAAPTFYKGAGCDNCRGTGYRGRIGIFEVLLFDKDMVNLVAAKTDPEKIVAAAVEKGMMTMFADGIAKSIEGKTTVEEVMRVLGGII
jgi:type IV pilus assembly protein PilB